MSEQGSIEELREQRDKLKKDLEDVKRELEIVKASVENPEQEKLTKNLKEEFPKLIKTLLENDAKKRKLMYASHEPKIVKYYRPITGIYISKSTVEFLPQEDSGAKCYLYKIEARMDTIQFKIIYVSNKSPTEKKDDEIMTELNLAVNNPSLQKEIQEGIDFFYNHSAYLQHAILFLKSVNKLASLRQKIIKMIAEKYEKYVSIAVSDNNGKCVLKCRGLAYPEYTFYLSWQIIFNPVTLLAKDVFKIQGNSSDIIDLNRRKIFNKLIDQICDYEKRQSYNLEKKNHLAQMAVEALVFVDSSSDSSDVTTEE